MGPPGLEPGCDGLMSPRPGFRFARAITVDRGPRPLSSRKRGSEVAAQQGLAGVEREAGLVMVEPELRLLLDQPAAFADGAGRGRAVRLTEYDASTTCSRGSTTCASRPQRDPAEALIRRHSGCRPATRRLRHRALAPPPPRAAPGQHAADQPEWRR